MPFREALAAAALVMTSTSGITLAQTPDSSASASATEQDLAAATCGEYLEAARAANPGPNPTAAQKVQAEAAQDALVESMLWLHGYQTGRAAAAALQPLTRTWMVDHIRSLAQVCKQNSDGKMLLVDAARQL